MSRPKYVKLVDPETGQPYLVPIEDYLGVDPGMGVRRTQDMLSRLPDAELAGYRGRGVVPHSESPNNSQGIIRQPPPNWRPLAGADQNHRGFGRAVTINGPNQDTVVGSIVETPRNNGDDAESLLITLGLDTSGSPQDLLQWCSLDIVCNLTWGVGGASFSAEVDWMNGTTFVIPANYARIGATIPEGDPNASPCTIVLMASMSYGTPTGGRIASPVRRTVDLLSGNILLPATSTELFQVPKFANSMTLVDSQANPSAYTIVFYKNVGLAVEVARFTKTARTDAVSLNESTFPIPNGALFYKVYNLGPAQVQGLSAIFNIAL